MEQIESLLLLEESIKTVVRCSGRGATLTDHTDYVLAATFRHCVRTAKAIHLLLTHGYISDSTRLLRSLMFDSHRLIYLNQHPNKRKASILSMEQEGVNRLGKLATTIRKHTPDVEGIDDLVENVKERRRYVQELMAQLGVESLERIPEEGANIAQKIGRTQDVVFHALYSAGVHSGAWSESVGPEISTEGDHFFDEHPGLIRSLAYGTSQLLFEAALAYGSIQGWTTVPEVFADYHRAYAEFKRLDPSKLSR